MRNVKFFILLSLILIPSFVSAKNNLFIKLGFRNGSAGVFEFLKYDKKKMEFEIRQSGQKQNVKVNELAFITIDTSATAPDCTINKDAKDLIKLVGGSDTHGVFRKMEKDKVTFVQGPSSENKFEVSLDSVEFICFSQNVLSVDRFEYGEGFNLLNKKEEIELGLAYAEEVSKDNRLLQDTLVDKYIDSLGKHIAKFSRWPDLDYKFTVINDDIVNAFTTGGGQVFLYRGLIENLNSEAELAAVIGHEIGHSIAHHVSRQLSKQLLYGGILQAAGGILNSNKNDWAKVLTDAGGVLAFFGLMKFSRDDEREADLLGFYNLYEAGINPGGMISLFETFSRLFSSKADLLQSWSADHPSSEERKENMSAEMQDIDAEGLIEDSERFHWIKDYLSALPPPEQIAPFIIDTFQVLAGTSVSKEFVLDDKQFKNCRLFGRFVAQYGNEYNDVRFLIMDEVNFINWSRRNKFSALLDTEKTSIYDVDFKFSKSGKYYFVFDNSYSTFTPKTVVSGLYIGYTKR